MSTKLRPAAGQQAAIAPAVFAGQKSQGEKKRPPQYVYEQRFLEGELRHAVLVDGKASQLNRIEAAQQRAREEGDPVLARVPQIIAMITLLSLQPLAQYKRGVRADRYRWSDTEGFRVTCP